MCLRRKISDSDRPRLALASSLFLAVFLLPIAGLEEAVGSRRLVGVLVRARQTTPEQLRIWKKNKTNAVVLMLSETEPARDIKASVQRIQAAGLDFYYWIEVGRNPAMAEAHPEWMASLQGHPEWRRHFPAMRSPLAGEIVKNYPWVPVVYKGAFEAHLRRVATLLKEQPVPAGILLNDLQSAPSACGCGNSLCRWTPDYGPIRTAARLPDSAAASFAEAVQELMPGAKIIPVWTTECEESDGAKEAACAGVGCFAGACWKEFTAQLMPVADRFDLLAVLLPSPAFERDLPRYGSPAGWVKHALSSFIEMPPRRQGKAISTARLIAVLQGWDVTPDQQTAQIARSAEAGSAGHIVALTELEQSWEPRIMKVGIKP